MNNSFGTVWKALLVVAGIAAAVFTVDARYVTASVFTAFKDGTIASINQRLDRIESKLDTLLAEKQ